MLCPSLPRFTAKHNIVPVGFTAAGLGYTGCVRSQPATGQRRVVCVADGSVKHQAPIGARVNKRSSRSRGHDRCSHVLDNIQCPVASQPAGRAYLPSKNKRGKPTGMAICFFFSRGGRELGLLHKLATADSSWLFFLKK